MVSGNRSKGAIARRVVLCVADTARTSSMMLRLDYARPRPFEIPVSASMTPVYPPDRQRAKSDHTGKVDDALFFAPVAQRTLETDRGQVLSFGAEVSLRVAHALIVGEGRELLHDEV